MGSYKTCKVIDLSSEFLDQISSLYMNENDSDIVFIINGERICAHKFILTLRCDYFRLMFSSGYREAIESEVEVKDTSIETFKTILNFIYTGRVDLNDKCVEEIIEILCICHRYELHDLLGHLLTFLTSAIDAENVCGLYETAKLYNFTELIEPCQRFLREKGYEVLNEDAIYALNANTILELFSDDKLCAEEKEIFKAVAGWIRYNPKATDEEKEKLLATVRLEAISSNDLISSVWVSGLVDNNVILEIFQQRSEMPVDEFIDDDNLRYCMRPIKCIEEVAGFVQDKTAVYRRPYEQTASIIFSCPGEVVMNLDHVRFFNYMEIHLGNSENTGYSYYVESSTDGIEWNRVADYMDFYCYSTQYLYFNTVPTKYLRIHGYRCRSGTNFIIEALKCYIREIPFSMVSRCRIKTDLDYAAENKNKVRAPLYPNSFDNCKYKGNSLNLHRF